MLWPKEGTMQLQVVTYKAAMTSDQNIRVCADWLYIWQTVQKKHRTKRAKYCSVESEESGSGEGEGRHNCSPVVEAGRFEV